MLYVLESVRLDKWLWAVRLFKTRAQAADACRRGRVLIDDQAAKPAREVRVGDVIAIRQDVFVRTVNIKAVLEKRVGASLVPDFMDDLTPPEQWQRLKAHQEERRLSPPVFPLGFGRPTKQQRRQIEKAFHRDT